MENGRSESNIRGNGEAAPVGTVLHELLASTKDLIEGKIELARAEIQEAAGLVGKHAGRIALGAGLTAASLIPLMAFAVIGLGEILDGRYWLSSLLVAFALLLTGLPLALVNWGRLKRGNLSLYRTKRSVEKDAEIFQDSVKDIQTAIRNATDGDPNTPVRIRDDLIGASQVMS